MAKKKQPNQPTFELNQQVEISGLGQCVIVDIHDDEEVKLEVFKLKDQDARFKNRYVVPVSDVIVVQNGGIIPPVTSENNIDPKFIKKNADYDSDGTFTLGHTP